MYSDLFYFIEQLNIRKLPSQNSTGLEWSNASKLKHSNARINYSVTLMMFIDHKCRLNYIVITVFIFSGRRRRFDVIEWMSSHKACRGLLLHHFSHRYFFF